VQRLLEHLQLALQIRAHLLMLIRRGGVVEAGDVAQHGGAKLHPAALARTLQRVGRVQARQQGVVQVFADHRRLKDRVLPDQQHRRLAQGRDALEPVGLVREVYIAPGVRHLLFRQDDGGPLDVRAQHVADEDNGAVGLAIHGGGLQMR
jgi:hypothetical protein